MSDFEKHLANLRETERLKSVRASRAINEPETAAAFAEFYGHSHERSTGKTDAAIASEAIYRKALREQEK